MFWISILVTGAYVLPGGWGWSASVEQATEPECDPPFVYSPVRVLEARNTAGRAQWTDLMIDGGVGGLSRPENQIKAACLKAVLFGGDERMAQAVRIFTDILGNWQEAGAAADAFSLRMIAQTTQCLDWLTAAPEWLKTSLPERQALRDRFAAWIEQAFEAPPGLPADDTRFHLQAVKLYAGLIAGATALAEESLRGNDEIPSLATTARLALTSEGLLHTGTLQRHVETGHDFLLAGAALRSCSPEAYSVLEPLLQKTVTVLTTLTYPAHRWPSVLAREKIDGPELIRFLELGYALFPDANLRNWLVELYKTYPRRPESLLFTEPSLLAGGPPEVIASVALPQSGAALIHDVSDTIPVSLYLDTGLSGRTGPSALLSIEWMDLPAPADTPSGRQNTAGFNTVVVNRIPQRPAPTSEDVPRNALLWSWKVFDDGTTYAKAVADGQYTERAAYPAELTGTPVSTYERTIYLSSPFAVDLFRARGGRTHDWIYHAPGMLESLPEGEWADYEAQEGDYAFLRDRGAVRAAWLRGVYRWTYQPRGEEKRRERVWIIDPVGTQLIAGEEENGSFVIARREMVEDEGNLYAVLHEWFQGDAAPDLSITRLALTPQPNPRDFQAMAFMVQSGSETHLFLSSMNPDVAYSADCLGQRIVFQGGFGHIRLHDNAFQSMRLIDGTQLRYGPHGLRFDTPLHVGVTRRVNEPEGWIELDLPGRMPDGPAMKNTAVLVLSNELCPVMYQPLLLDRIDPGEAPQKARLIHTPNLVRPLPSLGAPVKPGDPVLAGPSGELVRRHPDIYSLVYSAPAGVMVEGATNRSRIFLHQADVLYQIRGESSAGAIHFSMDPAESREGRVEFARIP